MDTTPKTRFHPDTQLTPELLTSITRWIARVVKQHTIAGTAAEIDALDLLRDVLGDGVTLAILRGLTGSMVLEELRQHGIKLPRNTENLFTGFAHAWTPDVPHCPSSSCALPGIYPRRDRSGVEVLPEGAVCPWCGEDVVRSTKALGTLTSWVSGEELPLEASFDDTTVPGSRLPLQEQDLRQQTAPELLRILDTQEVSVVAWLRHLMTTGHQVFGLTRAPLPVLASLSNAAILQHGARAVTAQVLLAKRAPKSARAAQDGHDNTQATEEQVYALLCKLVESQFEEVLFRASVPREHLPGASAGQALRASALIQLTRQGVVRLSEIHDLMIQLRRR